MMLTFSTVADVDIDGEVNLLSAVVDNGYDIDFSTFGEEVNDIGLSCLDAENDIVNLSVFADENFMVF